MSTKLTLLSTVFFIIFYNNLIAEVPTFEANTIYDAQKKSIYKTNTNLNGALKEIDKTFNNYTIIELNSQAIHKHLKTNKAETAFNLKVKGVDLKSEGVDVLLNLTLHDVLSDDFKHYEQTENGMVIHSKPKVFTYRGFTNDQSEMDVALAIKEDWVSGYFTYQNKRYFVNPVKQFDANYKNNDGSIGLVLYTADESKYADFECSVGKTKPVSEEFISKDHAAIYKNNSTIECTEIAVAYDQGFKFLHNDAQGVQNIIISRLNMVANLYTNWFEIDYKLIELYGTDFDEITPESNIESCQEFFPNCSENTILDDFQEWGEGQAELPNFGNGFNTDPDVATFWTSRDIIDGDNEFNIGYSFFEGICNERGYNICEDAVRYRGNEALQMTIWAHELGHTWNAYHTSENNTYMMNSSVTAEAVNVDDETVNSIANHKASRPCLDVGPCQSNCTNGDGTCVSLSLKVLLQGAILNSPDLFMRDDLRANDLLPLNEPYSDIVYFNHYGNGGGETIEANLLVDDRENSVVDWLLIELRDANTPSQIVETQSVLLKRNGTVVNVEGSEEITFNGIEGNYYIAIRHRNHLGIMTANPVSLENNVLIDFTDINTPTWGNSACVDLGSGQQGMWAGNSQTDNKLVFQGADNEATAIFFTVLQAEANNNGSANYIASGYYNSDVDMDGKCIFSGINNDPNIVFFNVLASPENLGAANFIIYEQLP